MNHFLDAVKAMSKRASRKGAARVRAGDGCTMSPDFTFKSCSDTHDVDYMNCTITRLEADQRLRACIAWNCCKNDLPGILPAIYYYGVRLFGASRYAAFKPYRYQDDNEWWM